MIWAILQNTVNCLFLVLCVVILSVVLKQNASDITANNVTEQIDLIREENRRVIGHNTNYLEGRVNELAKSQNDYQYSTSKKIFLLEGRMKVVEKAQPRQRLINNNTLHNNLSIQGNVESDKESN